MLIAAVLEKVIEQLVRIHALELTIIVQPNRQYHKCTWHHKLSWLLFFFVRRFCPCTCRAPATPRWPTPVWTELSASTPTPTTRFQKRKEMSYRCKYISLNFTWFTSFSLSWISNVAFAPLTEFLTRPWDHVLYNPIFIFIRRGRLVKYLGIPIIISPLSDEHMFYSWSIIARNINLWQTLSYN